MEIGPTYYQRIHRQWGHEEAMLCPVGMPLWQYRMEAAEGEALGEIISRAAEEAPRTGQTLADLARAYGISARTLYRRAAEMGIRMPRGVSSHQREVARDLMDGINRRRRHEY